ncbi:hypothetical protein N2152v2_004063 [Parachlorella kessleri]
MGFAWGDDALGQLGNAAAKGSGTPVAIDNRLWTVLSAGTNHACGVEQGSNDAYCWGDNSSGQLGIGDTRATSSTPLLVSGGLKWSYIGGGDSHSCGLRLEDSTAWCWGSADNGQLGTGGYTSSDEPVPVAGGQQWASLSVRGSQTCGILLSDGSAWCWGWPSLVQDTAAVPQLVPGGIAWAHLSAGIYHVCGIAAADGTAYCWGGQEVGNQDGQLGIGSTAAATTPTPVVGGRAYSSISSGEVHTCAVQNATAQLYCWGRNIYGQLGNSALMDGSDDSALYPQPTPAFLGGPVSSVSVGLENTCAIWAANATAACVGNNFFGAVGSGSTDVSTGAPQAVAGGRKCAALSGGGSFMVGLLLEAPAASS